jgi:purine-binding chemotaxis protein CheW
MLTKKPVREADRQPVLTFTLGDGIYALPIEEVIEVAAMVELIPLADAPPEILGMVNRHGEIMPVLDLRQVFKQPAPPHPVRGCGAGRPARRSGGG